MSKFKVIGLLGFYFILLFAFKPTLLSAQQDSLIQRSFADLAEIHSSGTVFYDARITEVIDKRRKSLPQDHQLYNPNGWASGELVLFKTKIDFQSDTEYYVCHDWGPSADPSFGFYRVGSSGAYTDFVVDGVVLYIPGNGFLYAESKNFNSAFNFRGKFKVDNNTLAEVPQPFYYVGLKSRTLQPITIYSDFDQKNELANLPANYEVEVILVDNHSGLNCKYHYLIKTPFGLIGWAQIQTYQKAMLSIASFAAVISP